MSGSSSDVVARAEAILSSATQLKEKNGPVRLELIKQLKHLYQDLEPPINSFFDQWISMSVFTCLDIAVKLGVFEHMKFQDGISAQQLSALVGVNSNVIARVMRILVAARIVVSNDDDTYSHTPKSMIYVKGERTAVDSFGLLSVSQLAANQAESRTKLLDEVADALSVLSTLLNVSFIGLPEYLKTRPSLDLLDIRKTPYACAYGMEGKTFYEVLSANPEHLNTFDKAMSEPGPDYGLFPFADLRDQVHREPDKAFLVDIGGGKGQATRYIQNATEGAFGTSAKFILQDRPEVLAQISPKELQGIDTMSYDFHTEQPVKGAHIYYLCQILHNYPDHLCQDILMKVAEAMDAESHLLIVDAVLPAKATAEGHMAGYLIDLVGLAMGGKERTENEFEALLSSVGLESVQVWQDEGSYQAVLQARLKRD